MQIALRHVLRVTRPNCGFLCGAPDWSVRRLGPTICTQTGVESRAMQEYCEAVGFGTGAELALALEVGVGTVSGDGARAGSSTARKSGERAWLAGGFACGCKVLAVVEDADDEDEGKRGELRA